MMIGEHEEIQPASEVGSLIEVSSTNEATHTSITATTAEVEGVEAEESETETASIPPPPITPFSSASRANRAQTHCITCLSAGYYSRISAPEVHYLGETRSTSAQSRMRYQLTGETLSLIHI